MFFISFNVKLKDMIIIKVDVLKGKVGVVKKFDFLMLVCELLF